MSVAPDRRSKSLSHKARPYGQQASSGASCMHAREASAALGCPEGCTQWFYRGRARRPGFAQEAKQPRRLLCAHAGPFTDLNATRTSHPGYHRARLRRCDVSQVAGRLWHLVSVRGGLTQHLAALKDYFLLARGDFYQVLLTEVTTSASGSVRRSSFWQHTHAAHCYGRACALSHHARRHSHDTRRPCASTRTPQIRAEQAVRSLFWCARRQSP